MTVAAFVVSIVALLVAGLSVFYTKQQAAAATKTAQLEAARRHDEEQPALTDGEVQPKNQGGWYRLHFRILHSPALARVEAEIVDTRGVSFRQGVDGVPPRREGRALDAFYVPEFNRVANKESLGTGDALYWVLEFEEERDKIIHIRLTCHAIDGRKWTIHRQVASPRKPPRMTYVE
ncbi:hypothetical protein [Amycolatopsis sp. NPDC001319]|uniref:hypothetical protein n=1 Tax=unclassified Amycolatopsis TaxID=2618356 RepID=UPI003679E8C8